MSAGWLLHASLALLPVLLFLVGLVQLDGYKLVRLRLMLVLMVAGALAAGASYLLNNAVYPHFPGDFRAYSRYVSPWIEEATKAALLVFLIRTRRVGLPVDAGIAGFAIGTGFALIENLYYLASRPDTALPVQVIRGFGTAIMHGGTAALLAMISITLYEKRPHGGGSFPGQEQVRDEDKRNQLHGRGHAGQQPAPPRSAGGDRQHVHRHHGHQEHVDLAKRDGAPDGHQAQHRRGQQRRAPCGGQAPVRHRGDRDPDRQHERERACRRHDRPGQLSWQDRERDEQERCGGRIREREAEVA